MKNEEGSSLLWIVITRPDIVADEAALIGMLVDMGVDLVHLRKPGMSATDYENIIRSISEPYRKHIVLHEHFSLCAEYGLRGIHLNSRWPTVPAACRGVPLWSPDCRGVPLWSPDCRYSISCSCHSIDEVAARKDTCDYIFLSPIFDSISKQGYMSAFTDEELSAACRQGIIDHHVIALGGVTAAAIPRLRRWGFGGAAFLGDIWNRVGRPDFTAYLKTLKQLMRD